MSVSVSMPQLGESVTEGTVTRWLKKEGERVEVDEPLLEVSTDKVDTEIPSPASGILRGIAVDEDETVAVGAQLAVIEDSETSESAPEPAAPPQDAAPAAEDSAPAPHAAAEPAQDAAEPAVAAAAPEPASGGSGSWSGAPNYAPPPRPAQAPSYAPPPAYGQRPAYDRPADQAPAASYGQQSEPGSVPGYGQQAQAAAPAPAAPAQTSAPEDAPATEAEEYPPPTPLPGTGESPYVTPLVRKLAAEHAVDLESVTGTGVGGRIRKQDVIDAARAQRASQAAEPEPSRAAQEAPAASYRSRRSGYRPRQPARSSPPPRRRVPRWPRARPWCLPRCAAPPSGCPGPVR